MKTSLDACLTTQKTSGVLVYIVEEVGDARLRCEQLKRYIKDATDLVEKSEHRDHFFEVAGNLIYGIPDTLLKLDKALNAAALGIARLDFEEIKNGLRPEKADELEQALNETRLRYLNRRSDDQAVAGATGPDKSKVKTWMRQHLQHYVDPKTGEANCTQMAEEACQALKLYVGDDIPEELFEWSQEIAEATGHGVRLSRKGTSMNAKSAAYFLNKIADLTDKQGRVPMAAVMTLVAKLEKGDKRAATLSTKASSAFRNIAKTITTQEHPSRVQIASVLRRIVGDTLQVALPQLAQQEGQQGQGQGQQQQQALQQPLAGAGEDFQKANPKITDEEAKVIDEMHDKNKDNLK